MLYAARALKQVAAYRGRSSITWFACGSRRARLRASSCHGRSCAMLRLCCSLLRAARALEQVAARRGRSCATFLRLRRSLLRAARALQQLHSQQGRSCAMFLRLWYSLLRAPRASEQVAARWGRCCITSLRLRCSLVCAARALQQVLLTGNAVAELCSVCGALSLAHARLIASCSHRRRSCATLSRLWCSLRCPAHALH